MPKTLYNEGRVVGLSAYEAYVRRKLSEDPNALVVTEREWLASSLGMGASLLLRVTPSYVNENRKPTGTSALYCCDFPLPKISNLGAANTIIGSFFDGEGNFALQDSDIQTKTTFTVSGGKVVVTTENNQPILRRKTTMTFKLSNPAGDKTITLKDIDNSDGVLKSSQYIRTNVISNNMYTKAFSQSSGTTLGNLYSKLNSDLAIIRSGVSRGSTTFKIYEQGTSNYFYDVPIDATTGNLIYSGTGESVGQVNYSQNIITGITNILPSFVNRQVSSCEYFTYLDVYVKGNIDYASNKITLSADENSTDIKYNSLAFSTSSSDMIAANLITSNITITYSYNKYETNTLWANRVTSYGRLLKNIDSSNSPTTPTTSNPTGNLPYGTFEGLGKYQSVASQPSDWSTNYNTKYFIYSGGKYIHNTNPTWSSGATIYEYVYLTEMTQMMDYLKIADAIILQPGKWSHDTSIASPYKDLSVDGYLDKPAILRLYFKNTLTGPFNILLTGLIDKDVIKGETALTSAINTGSPENGDFLGPAAYPWAAKVIMTTPTELTYYLKNSIRSGSENVIITQTDDSPEVDIAVRNEIDRDTANYIAGARKHPNDASNLYTRKGAEQGYSGKNVFVGQSDNNYAGVTKIGVKNLITKQGTSGNAGNTPETNNPSLPSGYAGKNVYISQTNDGAETKIGVKNVITSTNDPYITVAQQNDGATTQVYVNDKKIVSDNIVAGPGITVSVDAYGRTEITNAVADGNMTTLTRGTHYDIYWFNKFTGGRYEWDSYQGKWIRTLTGNLYVKAKLSKSGSIVTGATVQITTGHRDTDYRYLIRSGELAARSTNPSVGYSYSDEILQKHANATVSYPSSWIALIVFKGDYEFINSNSFTIASGVFSGIWNMRGRNSAGKRTVNCGASWSANCGISAVKRSDLSSDQYTSKNGAEPPDESSSTTHDLPSDVNSGLMLYITQYADGINGKFSELLEHINKNYNVDQLCIRPYANINITGSCKKSNS